MKSTIKTTQSPVAATAASLAPAPAPKTTRSPRVKSPVASAPATAPTVIIATIDVGFGNALYLRGDGPGLSWNKGTLLDCVAGDQWSITIPGVKSPVTFKFLLNDQTWSKGEDYVAAPASTTALIPAF
jgi:hypothetical protein